VYYRAQEPTATGRVASVHLNTGTGREELIRNGGRVLTSLHENSVGPRLFGSNTERVSFFGTVLEFVAAVCCSSLRVLCSLWKRPLCEKESENECAEQLSNTVLQSRQFVQKEKASQSNRLPAPTRPHLHRSPCHTCRSPTL